MNTRVGRTERSTSGDQRSVEMLVRWVPTNDSQPMPTHHWEAVVHVEGERVCDVRCYTRAVAFEEAVAALATADIDFPEDT